jgi:hypothetical protein
MGIFKKILIITGIIANFGFVLTPALASAQVNELKCGANSAATGSCTSAPKNQPSINETIARVINLLSSLVAVVAVIVIIIAGFRYITSGGDSNKTASARGMIINALIGLVIAVFAQVIVKFVLRSVQK